MQNGVAEDAPFNPDATSVEDEYPSEGYPQLVDSPIIFASAVAFVSGICTINSQSLIEQIVANAPMVVVFCGLFRFVLPGTHRKWCNTSSVLSRHACCIVWDNASPFSAGESENQSSSR